MWLLFVVMLAAAPPDAYREALAAGEACKAQGDFAGFEAALSEALRHGEGNEYLWRSLAWAQMHQGKWRESLATAEENLERHGRTGWTLEQLAESALLAGDLELARECLGECDQLDEAALGNAAGAIDGTRAKLAALTEPRAYETTWTVDIAYAGATERPVRLLIPQLESPRQRAEFEVVGAVSWRLEKDGYRDVIEVQQRPGEPFQVVGRVTLLPAFVGHQRLEALPDLPPPAELAGALGPFLHGPVFDPSVPACADLAARLRGDTPAQTVANILGWFRDNFVYDLKASPPGLTEILEQKTGVCHHYCAAFVALCRAAGVPAVVAHGVVIAPTGEFDGAPGSHGWAEVYLPEVGWTPVEPLDPTSLASFSAGRAYIYTDCANYTPDDTHFRFVSIQGAQNVRGRLVE